ncbi:hypothetical protein skT53_03420 [Effusibacillus dendaii]|uniref:Uncharacterized protein n=1 Tax=Effusibacillus dendaii TaxID=2743772 RepID=A0A7I8D5S7_9BACL|nr:hypothetical protein skT53_03420 [Effusibacillus dendaii]
MREVVKSSSWQGDDAAVRANDRVKVHIRCRKCGESFILRGSCDFKGHVDTGFKRCLCDNEKDFEIETLR